VICDDAEPLHGRVLGGHVVVLLQDDGLLQAPVDPQRPLYPHIALILATTG